MRAPPALRPSHPTAPRGCSGTLILHSFSIFSPPLPSLTCFLVLHQLSLPWVSPSLCVCAGCSLCWVLPGGNACFPPAPALRGCPLCVSSWPA